MPTKWARFRGKGNGGAPALDFKKLEEWQNGRSNFQTQGYSYSIKGGQLSPPPRPPREEDRPASGRTFHTTAPAVQEPPSLLQVSNHSNDSLHRPASSFYSQPSPAAADFAAQQLKNEVTSGDPNAVSPPSSPELEAQRYGPRSYQGGDVSPIDDMDQSTNARPAQPQSNIPQMRRERRKNADSKFNVLREAQQKLKEHRPHGHDVRWNKYTGEPTTDNQGLASQVNPQEYAQGLGKPRVTALAGPGKTPNSNAGLIGKRLRPVQDRQATASPTTDPNPKPEWRGASGRTTLVAPVNDDRNVAPLSIPRKSSKRAAAIGGSRQVDALSPVSSISSEAASSPKNTATPLKNGRNVAPSARDNVPGTKSGSGSTQGYPSPPLSDDSLRIKNSQKSALQPSQFQPRQSSLNHDTPDLTLNEKAIRRKPAATTGHTPQPSGGSSVYSQNDIHPAHAPPGTFPGEWTQPPSRFSVTTYATSAVNDSPRQSAEEGRPPLPTSSQQSSNPPGLKPSPDSSATAASILDRKRPVVKGYEDMPRNRNPSDPIKIHMDSPYYVSKEPKSHALGSHPIRNASPTSIDKSLPPAPPEESARDRVTQLNAKLEALANRRININSAIRQMTELMPTDNILASDAVLRKREIEKRKVENLKDELAEVQREEYELGLKLHRAYKRMDRNNEYEPTTLWVRRVTG